MTSRGVPSVRIRSVNDRPVAGGGSYVLYWMIAARRTCCNYGLDRALEWSRKLQLPVLVFEPLRVAYPWASARMHNFVLDGMRDQVAAFARAPMRYLPYVEPHAGHGAGLLEALAAHAAVVVTDDTPAFFFPRMIEAGGRAVPCRMEAIDSIGLLPLSVARVAFNTAHAFRRLLHRELPAALQWLPLQRLTTSTGPLAEIPTGIADRWGAAGFAELLMHDATSRSMLPVDQRVAPVLVAGGAVAGAQQLDRFVAQGIDRYHEQRRVLEPAASSGLSPYLHFGHVGAHQVFRAIAQREDWSPERVADTATGSKAHWWGMRAGAEAFLDELVTWRELGFNAALRMDNYDRYETLPQWALDTLHKHRRDSRPVLYDRAQLEAGETGDALWNAAQKQLLRDGVIHGYLRMLWGKKVLEWTAEPEAAFETLIDLNNSYALDGRDPNSYSGISWTFGRYDRPWPERPIFGTVRYMSSQNTARKLRVRDYLARYAAAPI